MYWRLPDDAEYLVATPLMSEAPGLAANLHTSAKFAIRRRMGAGPSDGAGNKVGCNLVWGPTPANSPPRAQGLNHAYEVQHRGGRSGCVYCLVVQPVFRY
ncbi:unnamed protein product [Clonostachys chloroleuca]|uniref:Uncharacterized protein n=1 Tax=Clonostachys chloroleuca TaxID=1926264 RepID=A0AA35QA87_9HYPO|nr:unnamed protein product [Clonostachys chloroleuca]